jgi:methionyl-tRNA formyltransferase
MRFDAEQRKRITLVGLGPTAASALEALVERFQVVGLVREGDDEVVSCARMYGIRVCSDASVAGLTGFIDEVEPDGVVISSYDRIIPASLLASVPFINVHYAPLPRYRGRATVNWALINGEAEASITIHDLVPELDAGGILHQEHIPIGPRDTVSDLYERLNRRQRRALAPAVAGRLSGDRGRQQDGERATYACARVPEDGEIDWSASTARVDRLIRALAAPFPGAYTFLGLDQLWVGRASPVDGGPVYEGRVPGRVVRVSTRDGTVDVLTGDGILRLFEVRVEGGRWGPASHAVRSVRQTLGMRTIDLVRRVRTLERELGALRGPAG